MTEYAQWDDVSKQVVAIRIDGSEETHGTGALPSPDAQLVWVEIVEELPDEYLPEYPELLGPAVMVMEDDGKVHRYFPDADFSVDRLRDLVADRIDDDLFIALLETDSYVVRNAETGASIPNEIAEQRQVARDAAAGAKERVAIMAPGDLPDFAWEIPHTRRRRRFEQIQPRSASDSDAPHSARTPNPTKPPGTVHVEVEEGSEDEG